MSIRIDSLSEQYIRHLKTQRNLQTCLAANGSFSVKTNKQKPSPMIVPLAQLHTIL